MVGKSPVGKSPVGKSPVGKSPVGKSTRTTGMITTILRRLKKQTNTKISDLFGFN